HTLAAGTMEKAVKLFDMSAWAEARTLAGHQNQVTSLAFSADNRTLASGCKDGAVKLWDASTGRELHALAGHAGAVKSVAFSPDGRLLVTSNGDKTVQLRDLSAGVSGGASVGGDAGGGARVFESYSSGVYATAFSPDKRWFATGGKDKTVRVWEVATGRR